MGFAYSAPVGEVAAEFPDIELRRSSTTRRNDLPNLANLVFAEEQGSFLVGVIAANASTAGNVGFIGGVEVAADQEVRGRLHRGRQGGQARTPPSRSSTSRRSPDFTGFNDPAKGKTAAEGMFDAGADVVYHAAGGSGGGVFEAAQAAGKLAIGVDADQYNQAAYADVKDVILTSMIKRVDIAVFDFIKSVVDGEPLTGDHGLRPGRPTASATRRRTRPSSSTPRARGLREPDHRRDDHGSDHPVT